MPVSVAVLRKLEEIEPQLRGVLISILEELERQREETVTKNEFNELKEIVRELAIAQRDTEKAAQDLQTTTKDLQFTVKDLQSTTKDLQITVKDLQSTTKDLQIAVRDTQYALQDLIIEHSKTRDQVGGLSNSVGYILENEAYKFLPALLRREFGLVVKGKLLRDFVKDNRGREIEVNILGQATRKHNRYVIVGESKSQLSKNKVSEFLNKKLKRLDGVFEAELFPILVTHMKSEPDVEAFAAQKGIKRVYYSYEFS
jgi:hypothetical protein